MKNEKHEETDKERGILKSKNNDLYSVDENFINFCKKFSERQKESCGDEK